MEYIDVVLYIALFAFVVIVWQFGNKYLALLHKNIISNIEPKELVLAENIAYIAVQAAEQIFGIEGSNEQKLEYVLSLIEKRFPSLDKDIIRAIIESAVMEYKQFRKEIIEES